MQLVMRLDLTHETHGSMRLVENKNPYILRCDEVDFRRTEPLKEQSALHFLFRSTSIYLHSINMVNKSKSATKVMLFSIY